MLKTASIDIRPPAVLSKKIGKVEKGTGVDEWRVIGTLTFNPGFPMPIPVDLKGEAWIVGEVNLAEEIIRSNPDIAELESVAITGITVEGYSECNFIPGVSPPILKNEIILESDAGGWNADIHMGDKRWNTNRYMLDIKFDNPLRSRVKITRHMLVDLGGTLGGTCTIASRNVVLHVVYTYKGLPPPPGELRITVVDADTFKPIPGALVRISYSDGTPVKAGKTDSSGTAVFILPRNKYVAAAYVEGYTVGRTVVECPGTYTITISRTPSQPQPTPIIPLPQVPQPVKPILNSMLWIGGAGLALYAAYKLIQGVSIAEEVRGLVEKIRRIR